MYKVLNCIIRRNHQLYDYLDVMSHNACNLYNAALFRERQMMTSRDKERSELQELQREVIKEVEYALPLMHQKRKVPPSGVLNYAFLNDVMHINLNADYMAMTAHARENVLKHVVHDISSYFDALKSYKKDASSFTGRPRLPRYKHKQGKLTFTMSNQECVIKTNSKGNYQCKLPKTKVVVPLGKKVPGRLIEVHVTPMSENYQMSFVFDDGLEGPNVKKETKRIASIDIGVDNLMAVTNNVEQPSLLIKGLPIKSVNQMYNKAIASIVSNHTLSTKQKFRPTKQFNAVTMNRNNRIKDYLFKTVKYFMAWCVENRIDTIVIGKNNLWKQESDMGKRNNQTFVQMPFGQLIKMIEYSAERVGIKTIEQEESYTSKASYLDGDDIPVYRRETDVKYQFSGKRVKRGLYKSKDGRCINADLNGSANIMRKAFPLLASNINFESITTVRNAYTVLN